MHQRGNNRFISGHRHAVGMPYRSISPLDQGAIMTDPVVPSPKPVKRNAEQDKQIADRITANLQYLDTIDENPEIVTVLTGRGYPATRLGELRTQCRAVQGTFTQRQLSMATQGQATAGLSGSMATNREMYLDFRETVRSISDFTAIDRKALGVNGTILRDKQQFTTQARTSYQAAQKPPYAEILANYGFSAEVLTNALKTLDTLSISEADQNSAIGDATKATADRNAAVKAMDKSMRQLRGIAKVALRKRPDLLKKLSA